MRSEMASASRLIWMILLTLVIGSVDALAQVAVGEREPNNTWSGAQPLASAPAGVVIAAGPSSRTGDLDFYRFYARAGDIVTFDIDGAAGPAQWFDSFLVLMDDARNQLATNDDGPVLDAGSSEPQDSELVYTFTADGTYTLVVTRCCDDTVLDGVQHFIGDYTLTITGLTAHDAPDTDGDSFPDAVDNCVATANTSQQDTDQDGVGDACNDSHDADGDEWVDKIDNCPGVANPDQTDTDGDGLADACEVFADVLLVEPLDTTRIRAEIALLNPHAVDVTGEIAIAAMATTLDRVTVSFFDTPCGAADQYVVSLNGQTIGTHASAGGDCTCTPEPQSVVFSGPQVASAFDPDGANVVRVTTAGAGSMVGWISARLTFAGGREASACLFDADGGDCTTTNMCSGGAAQIADLDVQHPFGIRTLLEAPVSSTPYAASQLPDGFSFGAATPGRYAVVTTAVGFAPERLDALQVRVQNTTCSAVDTFTLFLNGAQVASAPGDENFTCGCSAPVLSMNILDSGALASWTARGPNVLAVTNTANPNVQSSATSWVEATVTAGGRTKTVCLQGECGATNLCAGSISFNPVAVSAPVDFDVAQVDVEPFDLTTQSELVINDQDSTPPAITVAIDGVRGTDDWFTSNVTVTWMVVDEESAVSSRIGCDSTSITSDTKGTVLTCTATSAGGTASQSVTIKRDTTAPTLTCALTPALLSPANHKMVPVTAVVAASDSFRLKAVASNEADNGTGDGDTAHDIQEFAVGTADVTGSLRAERAAQGNGRVYSLTYESTDAAGNTSSCVASAVVPLNTSDETAATGASKKRPKK